MILHLFGGSPETQFLLAYTAFIVVILLMLLYSIYLLYRVLKNSDFALKDEELFFKAGLMTGEHFKTRRFSLYDLLWMLEARGALRIEGCDRSSYRVVVRRASPNLVGAYVRGFLQSSETGGGVVITKRRVLINVHK